MAKLTATLEDALHVLNLDEDTYLEIDTIGASVRWRSKPHKNYPINTNTAKALVNRNLVKAVGNTKNYFGEYALVKENVNA